MQRLYRRFSFFIGLLGLLFLLSANTVITRHLLDVQTDDQAWVMHAQQVLSQVAQIQSLLSNAETGQRGYIYTGDPAFLGPYDLSVSQIGPSLQHLAQLTVDNPEEQTRIASLSALVQSRMDLISTTILLFQSGHQDRAKEMVVSERGRLLLVKINKLMVDMVQTESSLRGSRTAAYQASVHRTIASIYLASGIVAVGILVLAYQILLAANRRDRRARARLVRERWFRSTLSSLGHAVIATDKRGRVTFINPKAERLMGVELLQAKGQPVEKVYPLFDEATLKPVENSVKGLIAQGSPDEFENEVILKNGLGNLIPIQNNVALIRDNRKKLLGAVLIFRDLTYDRKMQNAFRDNEKGLSSVVLAIASHKIDAPLVAACDLVYLAKLNESISNEATDLLTLAEEHLERVSHMTREILGFYRQPAVPHEVDLSVLVESTLRSFSSVFLQKNITVLQGLAACPPVIVVPAELIQAFSHLLSNAVDAVESGGTIRIQLSYNDSANENSLTLSVQDNGTGIAPTNRKRLFEPFFTTKDGAAYGLGLWTAKGIVERYGGSIRVNYGSDHSSTGTQFDIFFPITRPVDL
jgi:PAS domain S-box-containing protein